MSSRLLPVAVLCALMALVSLIYLPGLGGPFLFDDYSNLPQVQVNSLDPVELKDAALTNTSGRLRRPVANLSFALNGYFGGQQAFSYKLVNLIIHLGCGLLVYFLAKRITALVTRDTERGGASLVALIAAAVWLLHPIQVSTTLYVVQRMAQLSTLFAFLAVLGWLRWRVGLEQGSWIRSVGWLAVIGLGTLFSLLSKESGALIPLLLLVLEGVLFKFRCSPDARPRWAIVNGLLIGLPLAAGMIYTITHWSSFVAGYAWRPYTMGERLLTEIHAMWHYLRLIFIPNLGQMGLYYDHFPITRNLDWMTSILGLGLFALLGMAAWLARRQPILSVGILWFLAGHALESTFISLEPAFEHRNYLPLLGPALIMGYYVPLLARKAGELKQAVLAGAGLAFLLIIGLSVMRVDSWSSRLDFLQTQVRNHPESFRVNLNLINGAMRADNWDGALERIEAIRRNNPDEPSWPLLRLFVACGRGDLPGGWLDETHDVLQEKGVSKEVVLSLQALTGRKVERICPALPIDALISLVDRALLQPPLQSPGRLRSLLILQRARLQVLAGSAPKATQSYLEAWRAYPSALTPLLDLAHLQIALGQYGEADETISVIRQVVNESPFQIGETWVRNLESRLQRERVSSSKVDTQ